MRSIRPVVAAASLMMLSGLAHAQSKPNGDSKSDLAPLDQSGHSADEGPLAHANTPPIGGATVSGGSRNPQEMGPADAENENKQQRK